MGIAYRPSPDSAICGDVAGFQSQLRIVGLSRRTGLGGLASPVRVPIRHDKEI